LTDTGDVASATPIPGESTGIGHVAVAQPFASETTRTTASNPFGWTVNVTFCGELPEFVYAYQRSASPAAHAAIASG
jgi:hypothetical protein